jgi:hypothetical protein
MQTNSGPIRTHTVLHLGQPARGKIKTHGQASFSGLPLRAGVAYWAEARADTTSRSNLLAIVAQRLRRQKILTSPCQTVCLISAHNNMQRCGHDKQYGKTPHRQAHV